ncbi:Putative non-hem dioxygenase domain, isopenicillin N synthase-like superfamily [Colletotrichum destructivum]|uniref:Non-hem dioxygenase domain, isopenicillin N synthase-like superfamily n=1 Tax=Colletotrichum destructivum TaxID=34406 RepID=A0AAX4I6C4_9PEZI|nr:Putative non-hem dioxygenase domain, isopenicillin N synthase-like superfamily [Colletotrichum destructivum]
MSSRPDHALPKFAHCPPTNKNLNFVHLENLDFSQFGSESARPRLAAKLLDGASRHGLFTISGHGIPEDLYDSQVDLAHALLTIPPEEKLAYETTPEDEARSRYTGFKASGSQKNKQGFHKTLDHYNIVANNLDSRKHPSILVPHLSQTNELINYFRHHLIPKLLTLVSMILEVPKEKLLSTHTSSLEGELCSEYLRYLLYNPRPAEGTGQPRDLWLGGHTDWGSFTFQFSQPVSALQILLPSGQWKWVQYLPGALVVNVGEALELLTGGIFRAAVHRAVKPPPDQERAKRVGIIYFARPPDGLKLEAIDSPVLRKSGRAQPPNQNVYTMSQYLHARNHGYKRLEFTKVTIVRDDSESSDGSGLSQIGREDT